MNHVHKDIKDLMSYIITLVINVGGEDTLFYNVVRYFDLGKISHVLNYLHRRCFVGKFEPWLHENSLWRGHRAVILFII